GKLPVPIITGLVGLGIGVLGKATSDVLRGHYSGGRAYVGAAAGGFVAGAAAPVLAGTSLLAGLGIWGAAGAGGLSLYAGGAADSFIRQSLGGLPNGKEVFSQANSSGIFGLLTPFLNFDADGITEGSNSFDAIRKQLFTKLNNGTIDSISAKSFGKIFG